MSDNLRIGDIVRAGGGITYHIESMTSDGEIKLHGHPGLFTDNRLTLVTPKWEVGDRGVYQNIEFTVLDFRPGGNLITDYVMEGCGVQWFPPDKCTRIAIATDETRQAAKDFYRQYWTGAHAVRDGYREFVVSSLIWIRDVATLQDGRGNGYPARECTRVDKPEPIETPPEMRDQWREHFQQISNAQRANQIIGTRTVRYLNGGTIRIGQCDVSVYPLNRSDVPAVNLRVSNAGIRADELRQLAALLNEVADVLDS